MGICVVLGGWHVSVCPNEARPHAHSIVSGFAEETWPQLLHDFKAGCLKPEYRESDVVNLGGLPIPRRDLQRSWRYMMPQTVMASRGCSHRCDFCAVSTMTKEYNKRPIDDIVAEIRLLPRKRFAFNDVSLVEDREWTKSLLRKLIPLKKIWGGLCTFDAYQDLELMRLLQQSGCCYMLVGFESLSQQSLNGINKLFNSASDYLEGMQIYHDHGIVIQGCFVFGIDHDDKSVFERTLNFVDKAKVDIPRYAIYTPYPGTKLFHRLVQENRILTTDYSLYDTQHVVFRPKLMSPEELYAGFKWTYRETFRLGSICRRTMRASRNFPVAFVGNLAYNLYVYRLYKQNKFERPEYYAQLQFDAGAI